MNLFILIYGTKKFILYKLEVKAVHKLCLAIAHKLLVLIVITLCLPCDVFGVWGFRTGVEVMISQVGLGDLTS